METKAPYITAAPPTEPAATPWRCATPGCGVVLGSILHLDGGAKILVRAGSGDWIYGDALIQCQECGQATRWAYRRGRVQTPEEFIPHSRARRVEVDTGITAAELEIARLISERESN
jgi:hypothetical protein